MATGKLVGTVKKYNVGAISNQASYFVILEEEEGSTT